MHRPSRHAILAAAVLSITLFSTARSASAQAQSGSPAGPAEKSPPPPPAPAPAPERRPLMSLLDSAGLARPLEDLNINIYGHAEGSYTWNFDDPDTDTNFGRVFDFEHDEPNLNQLDLTVERTVDVTQDRFDVGGRMEWIYGADAGLIHSNGLFDWYDSPRDPENQFDLNQLYADFALPVGNGLLVRAGKFVTHMGYETINPTTNPFFSHSYLFGFAIPFTHTGLTASYALNDQWSVMGGFSRGWEQWEDNNEALDALGQVKWTPSDKTTVFFNFVTGPEQPDNESDWRTVLDFILTHAATDRCTLALNADVGWEEDATAAGGDAQWYGLAAYTGYKLSDVFTFNLRGEWFHDDDGTRIGVEDLNIYEVTAGLTITPFPNDRYGSGLVLRPELRADFADEDVFDDSDEDTQFTAAIDVIYKF